MGAIARFVLLPESKLDGLREAARPRKRLFRRPEDGFEGYLHAEGQALREQQALAPASLAAVTARSATRSGPRP